MLFAEIDLPGIALVLGGVTAVITALGGFVVVIMKAIWELKKELREVKVATDGLTTKLVEVTAAKNISEGREQGRAEQRAEGKQAALEAKAARVEEKQVAQDDVRVILETTSGITGKLDEVKEDTNLLVKEIVKDESPKGKS